MNEELVRGPWSTVGSLMMFPEDRGLPSIYHLVPPPLSV